MLCRRQWHPTPVPCLENPMDGGAWWAAVHGVAKSRTQLSNFTFIFHFHALEKELAPHSSVPAWRIPGTGEPGGLPSTGWHRVGHDWSDLAAVAAVYVTAVSLPSVAPWRSWFDHTGTRTFPHRTWRNWWWELHMCSRMRKKLVFCSSPLIPWL